MNYFKFTFVLILFFSCNSSLKKSPNLINEKPNIIIIYTDDQGYGDLSSFGSMYIKTPNIDALGAGGAILTDFLNASSTCSPSRAALLTGAYPIRTGVNTVLWPEGHGGFGGSKSKGVGLLEEYNCVIPKWKWARKYFKGNFVPEKPTITLLIL